MLSRDFSTFHNIPSTMGIAESKPHLQPPFQRLSEWTIARVEKLLTDYLAKDLDFGLDYHALSLLLDGDKEWSEEIIKAFGSPNGLINVLSFITGAGLAVMGEPHDKAACTYLDLSSFRHRRLRPVCFRAFDFSGTGSISLDETTILFMCALRGFVVITGDGNFPQDDAMETYALDVYRTYDKDNFSKLTKDEFLKWSAKKLNAYHAADITPDRFLHAFGLAKEAPKSTRRAADDLPKSARADNNAPRLEDPVAINPPSITTEEEPLVPAEPRADTAYSQESFVSS
ncbi:Aste57867_20250 [Aphanomyces stellatus]|uniref:Aste57867_20250 protein n=1 Tax=Aphanomyces stellatus TaxID=120398 RepID=A0A485LF89_9STRA|nr:hypothetical protein As57867_020184 [Aphanomyces stellatus]VFT96940.1 Aste57867_20250 [Aphanomyces stellatus]